MWGDWGGPGFHFHWWSLPCKQNPHIDRLPPQAQHSLKGRVVEKSEEAGGVLGTCVLVPDILQDVHFIHSLDLLLLLWPSPSS